MKGFTLIELLVAVLIIGILAGIAFPQYMLSIEKTRATEGHALAKHAAEASDRYFLVYGAYPNDMELLDITIPGDASSYNNATDGFNRVKTKNFDVGVTTNYKFKGLANMYPVGQRYYIAIKYDGSIICETYTANADKYNKVCQIIGGKNTPGKCLNINPTGCFTLQ